MKDEPALQLLSEMARTSREATRSHQPSFWRIFLGFTSDLNHTSRQIDNDGLRQTFFLARTLARDPLQAKLDHELQNQVIHHLKRSDEKRASSLEEISLAAATSLSVNVLSEQNGRDIIDTERLREEIEADLESVGNEAAARILLDITDAVRDVYSGFIEEHSQETVAFYTAIEESCDVEWSEVHSTLNERLIQEDHQAISWKRRDTE